MKRIWKKLCYTLVVIMFLVFTLGPILWCFIISISSKKDLFSNTVQILPNSPTLENYLNLLSFKSRQSDMFIKGLINSMRATFITLLIGLPIALMTAYGLSRFTFKGKKVIRTILLITIVIPVFTTIIPLYDMFSKLGLLDNNFWLSLVYISSFLPIITWILSNYIDTIPKELDEAVLIDGGGKIRVFFSIIIPICRPIILAVILMMFLMAWSQYQIPLILASSIKTKPLSMVVAEFTSKDAIEYGITAAAGILALLPPAIVAVIFRRLLILGLTQGSVKG